MKKIYFKSISLILVGIIFFSLFMTPLTLVKIGDSEKRYCDDLYGNSGPATSITKTLQFSSYKTLTRVYTDNLLPTYDEYTQPNCCAVIAGANAIGYWDYYKPNLVPDYDCYFERNGISYPRGQNGAYIDPIKSYLYTAMGTNVGGDGTTKTGFYNGIKSYITDKGYSLVYTDMGSKSSMVSNCKSAFQNNDCVVLFLNQYTYFSELGFTIHNTNYSFSGITNNVGHVCIAEGYVEYAFYQDDVLLEKDCYFDITFGNGTGGFLEINDLSVIDKAYSIRVV